MNKCKWCGSTKCYVDPDGTTHCRNVKPEPSDLEKVFVYLSEAEKERQDNFRELNDKLEKIINLIEDLPVWEK